jgi:hypothetical protein
MRTTDDLNPETFQPLGKALPKPAPAPGPAPEPRGEYGIVTDEAGRMQTTKDPR